MIVLCGASPSSLRHRMQTLCRLYRAGPLLSRAEGLKATLTTLAELQTRGPFAPVFHRAEGGPPVDLLGTPSRARGKGDQLPLAAATESGRKSEWWDAVVRMTGADGVAPGGLTGEALPACRPLEDVLLLRRAADFTSDGLVDRCQTGARDLGVTAARAFGRRE